MSDWDGLRPDIEWGGADVTSRQSRLDAAYDAVCETRHTGADRGAHHREPCRDPLLEGARAGNPYLALVWLQQMGMAGVGHEPGWPGDD